MQRSTFLLLALNTITFLWIYHLATKDENPAATPILELADLLGDPQRITIVRGFPVASTLTLLRKEEMWNLTAPVKWPAAEYAASKLVGRFRHIEVRRLFSIEEIEAKGENLADYGLDRPNLTLVVESVAGKVSLAFGAPTRDGREHYLLPKLPHGMDDEIWAVSNSLWDAVNLSTTEWMEHEFLRFPVYGIRAFGIRITRGETLTKTRLTRETTGDWSIVSPIRTPANPEAVRLFLNRLGSSKALRFVTDPAKAKTFASRLENPALRVNFEGSTGGKVIVVGEPIEGTEETNVHPAKVEGVPTVFLVDESFVSLITNAEGQLRDRRLLIFDPANISAIEIKDPNLKLSLHKLEDGRWEILLLDAEGEVSRRPGDQEIIEDFFSTLLSLEALSFVSDAPSEIDLEAYGLGQPRHSLTLTDVEGKTLTLRVGHHAKESTSWYARRDDAPFVFTVEETTPVLLSPSPLRFRQLLLERLPQGAKIRGIHLLDLETNASEIPLDANKTTALEPFIRQFMASEIVSEEYVPEGIHYRGEWAPWRYELRTDLSLPGGNEDENETRVYRFTERLGGRSWAGGSPAAGLSFLIPVELMDLLSEILISGAKPIP